MTKKTIISHKKLITEDHFSHNIVRWYNTVVNRIENKKVKILIVGVSEGLAPLFLIEKSGIKLGEGQSLIYCVDDYSQSKETLDIVRNNLKPYHENVRLFDGNIEYILRSLDPTKHKFDFIYINSAHNAKYQVQYGVLCSPLLKQRGILGFHNYTNNKEHDNSCPKKGIDAFFDFYANEYKILLTDWEVFALKRSKPLISKYCYSEFYHENLEDI